MKSKRNADSCAVKKIEREASDLTENSTKSKYEKTKNSSEANRLQILLSIHISTSEQLLAAIGTANTIITGAPRCTLINL